MTDVYRWAVVAPDGRFAVEPTDKWSEQELRDAWKPVADMGYRVARFKLVECAEGEGDGE